MTSLAGVVLLAATAVLLVTAVVVIVRGIRGNPAGQVLPTTVTGPALALVLAAVIAGIYGFVALFGTMFGIGMNLPTTSS